MGRLFSEVIIQPYNPSATMINQFELTYFAMFSIGDNSAGSLISPFPSRYTTTNTNVCIQIQIQCTHYIRVVWQWVGSVILVGGWVQGIVP